MSLYESSGLLPRRFRLVLASFLQRPGLPFGEVITEEFIARAFHAEQASFGEAEEAVYTPAITLWAFLSQVLFKGEQRSCVAAVARVAVLLVALERGPCSGNTGAYCRARAKLPEAVLRRLAVEVADGGERRMEADWLWRGRHVYLVDGTTVSLPDTLKNQRVYPQPRQQRVGLGFPMMRLVALLSLATGMVQDVAKGPYAGKERGETALLRQLLNRLEGGAVLLADRYYCSYFLIALLRERGVDFVTRVHQRRRIDFRRGRRLGCHDHLVTWRRPIKPDWMDQATYDRMPAALCVRELRVQVNEPGFRVESLVVVTTLTDAQTYSLADVGQLYSRRWLAELDLRAIKISVGLDVLRCKTPSMVHKEIWTGLLAYNLIRQTMLQSARECGRRPRELSFSAALQIIAASWQVIVLSRDSVAARLVQVELRNLAKYIVGDRPGRVEPRAIKRRPKPHDLLTKPRREARAELLGKARS